MSMSYPRDCVRLFVCFHKIFAIKSGQFSKHCKWDVKLMIQGCRDMTPCELLYSYRRTVGAHCFLIRGVCSPLFAGRRGSIFQKKWIFDITVIRTSNLAVRCNMLCELGTEFFSWFAWISDFRLLKKAVTRQAVYVWRNIEARSCNHCCSGKATSITYSECVFCSLRYAACNAHVSIILSSVPVCLCSFFGGGGILNVKMGVLVFCTTFRLK